MSRGSTPNYPRSARGVGLVEVLIAVLVLGVGMLGIAALQATTLRNSQGALERSQAVVHTYGILDAMRANLAVARNNGYDLGMTCAPPAAVDLVTRDQRNWIQSLQDELGPSACGQITCVGAACTINVRWDDARGGATNQQLQTQTRL